MRQIKVLSLGMLPAPGSFFMAFPAGRAFHCNLFAAQKGFPLQSLTHSTDRYTFNVPTKTLVWELGTVKYLIRVTLAAACCHQHKKLADPLLDGN